MPVIAIAAAVFAVEAAVAATTLFTVLAAVGAVAGAIGSVTGNKDLMKIGAVVGLVGGIGAIADNAGLFGAGAEASVPAGNAVAEATKATAGQTIDANLAAPTSAVPNAAAETAANAATNTAAPAAQTATEAAQTTASPVATAADATVPTGAIAQANAPSTTGLDGGNVYNPTNGSPTPAGLTESNGFSSNAYPGGGGSALATSMPQSSSFFDNLGSMFKGAGDFIQNNDKLSSSIFQGIASAADPSQRNLREAQASSLNANADQTRQITQNMNGVGGAYNWNINPTALNNIFPKPTGAIPTVRRGT